MPSHDSPAVAARRQRLQAWIDERFEGRQTLFVAATGINQGELSGLLKTKSFGEKKAAKLETQAGMPAGYLANPLAETEVASAESRGELIDLELFLYADEMLRHEERMQGAPFPPPQRLERQVAMYNLAIRHGGVIPREALLDITHAAYSRNPTKEGPHERPSEASGRRRKSTR